MKMNNRKHQGQLHYKVIKTETIRNRISFQKMKVSKIMKVNDKYLVKKIGKICNVFFQNELKDIKKIK